MKRLIILSLILGGLSARAQEKSVRPDINKPFQNPDVKAYLEKFEVESREIYTHRKDIVAACKLKPGTVIADIGAGTGLFTLLFAPRGGAAGRVYAVDIAPRFLEHVDAQARQRGLANITTVHCGERSVDLPDASIDVAFVCDTYHHFEYPRSTLASLRAALRPGGQLVVVDFVREPGVSSEWILGHVRAGQQLVTQEIEAAGFRLERQESTPFLRENYCLRFVRT
jgi:ubiquinone/menaquinone biosynthesis C-methylase UbiE